jgi:hypothetical protein
MNVFKMLAYVLKAFIPVVQLNVGCVIVAFCSATCGHGTKGKVITIIVHREGAFSFCWDFEREWLIVITVGLLTNPSDYAIY